MDVAFLGGGDAAPWLIGSPDLDPQTRFRRAAPHVPLP